MFTISKHGISISLSLRVRFSAYQLVKPRHFSLMCLYHPGKVRSDVFVSMVSLSTIFYSGFWSYSEFGILITVPTVWYSANCSDNMAYWNYSDNLVFLELFRQPNDFGAISTVWYFFVFHCIWPLCRLTSSCNCFNLSSNSSSRFFCWSLCLSTFWFNSFMYLSYFSICSRATASIRIVRFYKKIRK